MRIDKQVFEVVSERDYAFKAWRILRPSAANLNGREQVAAILFSHRGSGWVLRVLWRSGSGYNGGRSLSLGWRTDSARWQRVHRGKRVGFMGFEVSTSCNGPYMSR
jgi:hypothetical protein